MISSEPLFKEMKIFHKKKVNYGISALSSACFNDRYRYTNSINNYYIACEIGFLLVAKYYLKKIYHDDNSFLAKYKNCVIPRVCRNGHFEMLKWLEKLDDQISLNIYYVNIINNNIFNRKLL